MLLLLENLRFQNVPCFSDKNQILICSLFFSDKSQIVRCSLFPDAFGVLTGSPGVSDVDVHGEAPAAQGGE